MEGYPVKERAIRGWRKTKRPPLTAYEKIRIIYEVAVQHENQTDVARSHRISPAYVCRLYKTAMKNKNFMDEMLSMKESKETRQEQIKLTVTHLVESNTFIDSVDAVRYALPPNKQKCYRNWEIRHVMRNELRMSYKKVNAISIHANSDKNRVLR